MLGVPAALPWQQSLSQNTVDVWSDGTVAVSSLHLSKAQVNQIVEELARKLAAAWQGANP